MRQHRYAPRERDACLAAGNSPYAIPIGRALVLLFTLVFSLFGDISSGAARQADSGFSPASGTAQVIAQGVVALPEGDAVWRTVRTRALLPADAPFEERPLGFVLASSGPLLLIDQESGEQVQLGTSEAALVHAGTVQQRSSLGSQPASYLSIELVGVDAAPPPRTPPCSNRARPFRHRRGCTISISSAPRSSRARRSPSPIPGRRTSSSSLMAPPVSAARTASRWCSWPARRPASAANCRSRERPTAARPRTCRSWW